MYSKKVRRALERKKIKAGDKIRLTKGKKVYEGILMPRIELGDRDSLVLKLGSGYNFGIKYGKGMKIKRLKRGKPIEFKPAKVKVKKDPGKPTVSILGCGGTVASRIEYRTGAVYPAFSPGDLLESFPHLKEIANIEGRKLFDLFSEDITPDHWQIIARECTKEIKKGVDGVILTHGTDTMHYTSAVLGFMLQNLPVPIVLVGSQRSSDRGSSDNAMNLTCSVLTAAKSDIAEVVLCMHGTISDDFCYVHKGSKVRKCHTSRRDTFRSINESPYAKVWYFKRKIEYLRDDFKKRDKKRKLKLDTKVNPDVGLIWIHPGIKPEFIKKLGDFYDGIVVAGTGLGHLPANKVDKYTKPILPALKNLIESSVPVVIAPQTIWGRIDMNVYSTGRDLLKIGVIGNYCDFTPETALVKLMFVLGHTKEMDKVKELMEKNSVGEISKRSESSTFI